MKRHCILDRDSISRLAAEICTLPWLGGEYSEMQMACTFILPPFLSLWRGRRSTPVSNLFVHFWVMVPHGSWSSPVWLAGYFLSSVVSEHSSTAGFYVGSGAWTQVLTLARQALYPVSCLPQTFLSTTIFISVVLGYLFLLDTFNYSYQILPNFWECFYGHLTHNTLHITSVSWLEYLVLRGDENSYIRPALMDYLCHDHLWQPPAVTHGPLLRIML